MHTMFNQDVCAEEMKVDEIDNLEKPFKEKSKTYEDRQTILFGKNILNSLGGHKGAA